MKLGTRLGLSYLAVVVLLLICSGLAIVYLAKTHGWMKDMTEDNIPRMIILEQMMTTLMESKIQTRSLLITTDAGQMRAIHSKIIQADAAFDSAYMDYLRHNTGDGDDDIHRDISETRATVRTLGSRVVMLAMDGKTGEAKALMNSEMLNAYSKLMELMDRDFKLLLGHNRRDEVNAEQEYGRFITLLLSSLSVTLIAGIAITLNTTGFITGRVGQMMEFAGKIASGENPGVLPGKMNDEIGQLSGSLNRMSDAIFKAQATLKEQQWLKSNLAHFAQLMQGQRDMARVSQMLLSELAPLVDARHGVFYIKEGAEGKTALRLLSSYGYTERKNVSRSFAEGEGLVGQCAVERQKILLTNVPSDYVKISSGLGEAQPLNILVIPVIFENNLIAVMELASFNRFSEPVLAFLDELAVTMGVALNSISVSTRTDQLLLQLQQHTEELRVQREELEQVNSRLEAQANTLRQSESLLKEQQEELHTINEDLEEKAELLTRQKGELEQKNVELERMRAVLEEKARQLAITSHYKSEFLSTMSHELRTPLNSLLILSKQLSQNREGNLIPKQIEYAQTIYSAGNSLLDLINDILDLSRIESGTVRLDVEECLFAQLAGEIERLFRHVAETKRLEFTIDLEDRLPRSIMTDRKRVHQVLSNLLSNAFKFTEKGSVSLRVEVAEEGWSSDSEVLNGSDKVIAFSVSDTGIGIPADKWNIIFEAFQQADSTTSRRYGGTGLGLAISREIASLLGGELTITKSEPGKGSLFVMYLPLRNSPVIAALAGNEPSHLAARPSGVEIGQTASSTVPAADVPAAAVRGIQAEKISDLLIVEDMEAERQQLVELLGRDDVRISFASSGQEALEALRVRHFNCMVMDIGLPDMDGFDLLDRTSNELGLNAMPIVVNTARELTRQEEIRLRKAAERIIIKDVRSHERLVAEVSQFLNNGDGRLVQQRLKAAEKVRESDNALQSRKVLVIDDDIRNIFALTSVLEQHGAEVLFAENGREGLEMINKSTAVDAVLMDIMMPEMDGYEAIHRIRAIPGMGDLPVIAVTAKVMKGDRERCIDAGASDFIIKPVDAARLVSMLASLLEGRQAVNGGSGSRQIDSAGEYEKQPD